MPTRLKPRQQQTVLDLGGAPALPQSPPVPLPEPPAISPLIDDTQTSSRKVWSSHRTAEEIAVAQLGFSDPVDFVLVFENKLV